MKRKCLITSWRKVERRRVRQKAAPFFTSSSCFSTAGVKKTLVNCLELYEEVLAWITVANLTHLEDTANLEWELGRVERSIHVLQAYWWYWNGKWDNQVRGARTWQVIPLAILLFCAMTLWKYCYLVYKAMDTNVLFSSSEPCSQQGSCHKDLWFHYSCCIHILPFPFTWLQVVWGLEHLSAYAKYTAWGWLI